MKEELARLRRALRAVRHVESAIGLDRRPPERTYRCEGAWAHADGHGLQVPVPEKGSDPSEASGPTLSSRAHAVAVRLGKFDLDRKVRCRAFYTHPDGQRTVTRIQAAGNAKEPGVRRALKVRTRVAELAPGLAPELLGHGRLRGRRIDYLHEAFVVGRHPTSRNETQSFLPRICEELVALHRRAGLEPQPVGAVLDDTVVANWAAFADDHLDEPSIREWILELLAREGRLHAGVCHGDLVASNIVVDDENDRFTLIDWEWAGHGPVVFDVSKLVVHSRRPSRAIRHIATTYAEVAADGDGTYTVLEQLALAQVRVLSWYPHRYARAVAAGRTRSIDWDTNRRVRILELLHDRFERGTNPAGNW